MRLHTALTRPVRAHAGAALIGVASLLPTLAFAQTPAYPVKPVRVLVGFSAGGPTDVIARAFADRALRRVATAFAQDPVTQAKLRAMGMEPQNECADAFAARLAGEVKLYGELTRSLDLKTE